MFVEDDPVLVAIREATIKEELAIPVYDSHITAALFWSGLPEKTQERIIAGLKTLTSDSKKHVLLLKRVEALVREERVGAKRGSTSRRVGTKQTAVQKGGVKRPVNKKTASVPARAPKRGVKRATH